MASTHPFTIEQRMTTPTKPGKQPRPVFVAVGSTAGYEQAFRDLGGRRYHGEWSFFDDPTERLENAARLSFAEQKEYEKERAADRADRYAGYAENAAGRAAGMRQRADAVLSHIPFGQPNITDTSAGRTARNQREKALSTLRRSWEEEEKAGYLEHRAKVAERKAEGTHSIGFMMRRKEEAETELRLTQATIDGKRQMYGYEKPAGEWLAQLQGRLQQQREKVDYWAAQIAAAGGVRFGPDTIKKGDRVTYWGGTKEVVRVNKKSVTVPSGYSWTDTVPYDKITAHESV